MKRVSALVMVLLMAIAMVAPAAMAANSSDADTSVLKINKSTPENGADGVSVENLSVKLTMNKEMAGLTDAQKKSNQKAIKLTDPDGKRIKVQAYYSADHPDQVMIVSATSDSTTQRFDSATEYTVTIDGDFQSVDGSTLGEDVTISFTTLNQTRSMAIYMVLMAVMMVGMVFFTTRSTKRAMEKENENSTEVETVNPYKEAKRTGKSVEEIVAAEQKKKAKAEEAAAKKRAEYEALEAEIRAEERKKYNKRVSGRKPISAAGSEYKVTVTSDKAKKESEKKSASTNPKGQSGKQKNKKKK